MGCLGGRSSRLIFFDDESMFSAHSLSDIPHSSLIEFSSTWLPGHRHRKFANWITSSSGTVVHRRRSETAVDEFRRLHDIGLRPSTDDSITISLVRRRFFRPAKKIDQTLHSCRLGIIFLLTCSWHRTSMMSLCLQGKCRKWHSRVTMLLQVMHETGTRA